MGNSSPLHHTIFLILKEYDVESTCINQGEERLPLIRNQLQETQLGRGKMGQQVTVSDSFSFLSDTVVSNKWVYISAR